MDRLEARVSSLEDHVDGGPVTMRGSDTDDGVAEKLGARIDAIAGHLGISVAADEVASDKTRE